MTNVNDILARIDTFAAARDNDKTIRENETKLKAEMLVEFINVNFAERIDTIVTVANHLVKNGIPLKAGDNGRTFHDWRENIFVSDGFYHQLGLFGGRLEYNGLRIAMGGACGNRTMIFNTNNIYVCCEHSYGGDTIDTPRTADDIRNLESFINQFEQYEDAFYKWVEAVTNTNGFRTEYSIKNIIETDKYTKGEIEMKKERLEELLIQAIEHATEVSEQYTRDIVCAIGITSKELEAIGYDKQNFSQMHQWVEKN